MQTLCTYLHTVYKITGQVESSHVHDTLFSVFELVICVLFSIRCLFGFVFFSLVFFVLFVCASNDNNNNKRRECKQKKIRQKNDSIKTNTLLYTVIIIEHSIYQKKTKNKKQQNFKEWGKRMKSYKANIEICSFSLRESILFIKISQSTQYIKSKFLIIASSISLTLTCTSEVGQGH